MPDTQTQIEATDLAAELVALNGGKFKSFNDFKRRAKSHVAINHKESEIVDVHGKAMDLPQVLNLLREVIEEAERVDEMAEDEDIVEGKNDELEEEEEQEGMKALAEVLTKDLEKRFKTFERTQDARVKALNITGGEFRNDDKGKNGFKHFGEMAHAVYMHKTAQGTDDRLKTKALPTSFSTGGVGADGGFLIPPDYRSEILRYMLDQPSIMRKCRMMTTASNAIEIPIDQTTPWGGDGLQAEWLNTDRGKELAQSKLDIGEDTVKLEKLAVFAPVTNDLLEDSAGLALNYIPEQAGSRMAWKVDDAILNGTGAGQPQGILGSGALATVARATGGAIGATDVATLLGNLPPGSFAQRQGLAYVCANKVLPDLLLATIGDQPLFTRVHGEAENSPALLQSLYGIDLMVHQAAQARGTAGDLQLHDFNQYLLVTKSEGIRADMSIHLYFDSDQSAFRFIYRIGGQPWTNQTIPENNGSGVLSYFNQIAT